jgi:hypothetical protein
MTEPHAPATYLRPVATSAQVPTAHRVRSMYRQLVSRGLDPNEAANLTAFINGIKVGAQPWTVNEVSHLLFLRELYRVGRFGRIDGNDR